MSQSFQAIFASRIIASIDVMRADRANIAFRVLAINTIVVTTLNLILGFRRLVLNSPIALVSIVPVTDVI